MRKWRGNEEMERDSLSTFPRFFSLYFLPLYPFPLSNDVLFCFVVNVKSGTFVANVTRNLTYAL